MQKKRLCYSGIREKQDEIQLQNTLHSRWVLGFVDGEGCFHVGISENRKSKLGVQILPEFTVVQHSRDVEILQRLKTFFDCGVVRVNNGDRLAFRVRKRDDLCTKIIPFFDKYPLNTKKSNDFLLFKRVLDLMQKGAHFDPKGVEKIRKLSNLMNRKGAGLHKRIKNV